MRKILMRSAMPFGEEKSISDILIHNLVGNNTGNLIYQYSLARTVLTDDAVLTTIKTNKIYSDEEIARWNAEYEIFLIPLANAFRPSFKKELKRLTNLVRRLTIPCVVAGVGIEKKEDDDNWQFDYDEEVTEFIKAVLDKSSIVGLRGELTAKYLKRLGFIPEKDFTVIGCPSLYTFGDNLPVPDTVELTPRSKVTFNFKAGLPDKLYTFLRKQGNRFQHSVFITQVINEIKTLYTGYPYLSPESVQNVPEDYPMHFSDFMMKENRIAGVLDDLSWIRFIQQQDFNFGSRIHGNIVSILAGTPCYIFAGDLRVKELAQYHHIPYLPAEDIHENTDVIALYEKTDYGCLMDGHKERLTHYLDFLDANGVKRLTREQLGKRDTPFDHIRKEWKVPGIIRPFPVVSVDEQERRLQEYFAALDEQTEEKRRLTQRFRKENKTLQKEAAKLTAANRTLTAQCQCLHKELTEIKSSRFYKMKVKVDSLRK